MEMVGGLLVLVGFVGILCSIPCTLSAYYYYSKRPDRSWWGFNFARFYYGDFRREHMLLFAGSLGGVLTAIACNLVGTALMGAH